MKNTTKNAVNFNFSMIDNPWRQAQDVLESKTSGKEYVNFGKDNDFPQYLWSLYLKSAIAQAIINGTSDYIAGNGVQLINIPEKFKEYVNADGETMEDIIKKIATDYMIFGGFALQLIYNNGGELNEIYWMDIQNIRLNEEESKVYYSRKWGKYNNDTVKYKIYDKDKLNKNCVFYFKGHISRGVYPVPFYMGALNSIETSTEIGKYHLNNIINNLDAGTIISFNNGVPSLAQQKELEKKINNKFSGANNAGRTIVTFSDNKESAPTINKLGDDGKDKKFESLFSNTMKEIFVSFRATPTLFGLQVENNGFSKEEFLQAFELYNKTVVVPLQRDIERSLDKIFDVKNSVKLNSFKLAEVEDNDKII